MDISNLDYTTKSIIYVKKCGKETPEKYECSKKLVESVASIVRARMLARTEELHNAQQRKALLRRIAKLEDAFVEGVCKTFN